MYYKLISASGVAREAYAFINLFCSAKPILEYTCIVWAPHTQKNISTIEAVLRRAAKYVTNNYSSYASVSEMLTHLQWTSLNNQRESLKIIMLYKIIQQLVDVPKPNIIPALDYYHT